MRSLLLLVPVALLAACPPASDDDDDGTEEPTPSRPGPDYSLGDCPTLSEGTHGFDTALAERRIRIDLPDDPQGAPVVFAWHWLGGSADEIMEYGGFDQLPADEGAIVIAPESSGSQFEWAFLSQPEDNIDLQLFEDLLACAWRTWDVDLDRVYSTGMSAGGLWTSYLLMYESQWLAAAAPLSGGANSASYVQPARRLPVMLTWGGPTDYAQGLDFDSANRQLSQELRDDGHFVPECVHSGGHTIPNGAKDVIWRFFEDHPMGVDPEPYADGLPSSFPSYCAIPE